MAERLDAELVGMGDRGNNPPTHWDLSDDDNTRNARVNNRASIERHGSATATHGAALSIDRKRIIFPPPNFSVTIRCSSAVSGLYFR